MLFKHSSPPFAYRTDVTTYRADIAIHRAGATHHADISTNRAGIATHRSFVAQPDEAKTIVAALKNRPRTPKLMRTLWYKSARPAAPGRDPPPIILSSFHADPV
jgi:hypothetical protein